MEDKDAIVTAVKDYWEGWFGGDAERMARAVHPSLAKSAAWADDSGLRLTGPMTAGEMIGWTRDGDGVPDRQAGLAYEYTVHDVYHEIATVSVRSGIYREFLHLVKTPGGWRILNALYMRTR